MSRKYIFIVACLLLAVVVFVTLSPIHLRPRTGHPNLERFGAFLVLGGAYTLALPRRTGLVAVFTVAAALALEAAQTWAPTRDPSLSDAVVKSAGALVGVGMAWLINGELALRAQRRRPEELV